MLALVFEPEGNHVFIHLIDAAVCRHHGCVSGHRPLGSLNIGRSHSSIGLQNLVGLAS